MKEHVQPCCKLLSVNHDEIRHVIVMGKMHDINSEDEELFFQQSCLLQESIDSLQDHLT